MTNEAAERPTRSVRMSAELVDLLSRNGWEFDGPGPDGFWTASVRIGEQYRGILAAERRATVERIGSVLRDADMALKWSRPDRAGLVSLGDIAAILLEEAAR